MLWNDSVLFVSTFYYVIGQIHPVRTRRRFNVDTTSSQRCGRCIDVEPTVLCAYREMKIARAELIQFSSTRVLKLTKSLLFHLCAIIYQSL